MIYNYNYNYTIYLNLLGTYFELTFNSHFLGKKEFLITYSKIFNFAK